jgi:hypothetical protein
MYKRTAASYSEAYDLLKVGGAMPGDTGAPSHQAGATGRQPPP